MRRRGLDHGRERSGVGLTRFVLPLFLTAALYYAIFGGEVSIFELRGIRAQVIEEQAALDAVRMEIDSLTAWADSLQNDPGTIERVAREDHGMIREGETLYRFAEATTVESTVPQRR